MRSSLYACALPIRPVRAEISVLNIELLLVKVKKLLSEVFEISSYPLSSVCLQLKKIGKRYKTQSEKLQQLLKENNIIFQHITNPTGGAAATEGATDSTQNPVQSAIDSEEKKKLQEQITEKINTINEITAKLTSLEAMLETEKTSKMESDKNLNETQTRYIETEKKLLEMKKEIEKLTTELNEEKVRIFTHFFTVSIRFKIGLADT